MAVAVVSNSGWRSCQEPSTSVARENPSLQAYTTLAFKALIEGPFSVCSSCLCFGECVVLSKMQYEDYSGGLST